jgi:hypothetical protein
MQKQDVVPHQRTDATTTQKQAEYQARLEAEWTTLYAIRSTLGIAWSGSAVPTYADAQWLGEKLWPQVLAPENSLLHRDRESDEARLYRQKAAARTSRQPNKEPVTAVELVKEDIRELEQLIEGARNVRTNSLETRLRHLYDVQNELLPQRYSESQLIQNIPNTYQPLPVTNRGRDTIEIELPRERILRVRLLHPNRPEMVTGADVLYEHYDDRVGQARLLVIQFKMWDGKALYWSKRLGQQLSKLQRRFCGEGLCKKAPDEAHRFGFPYCSAFLRPTDEIQSPDSRLVSSGFHVPICAVEQSWKETQRDGAKLEAHEIQSTAVSHRIFDELFNSSQIGSRWLTTHELQDFYKRNEVFGSAERVVLHAQNYLPIRSHRGGMRPKTTAKPPRVRRR